MGAMEAWRDEAATELFEAILRLESVDEASAFFRDLCTLGELHDMAQRWAVVRLLDQGLHYAEISQRTGASTATITRIAQWLHHGEGGYLKALERLKAAGAARPTGEPNSMTRRLRLAIPNKGRLVEPTVTLLRDAGLVFEPGERALVARVQNFDLDILFVRTNDIVEFVADGVAELGVTGLDLVAESGVGRAADPHARLRALPPDDRRPQRLPDPRRRRIWRVCASPLPT